MNPEELKNNFSMFIYKTTNLITGKFYIGQKRTPMNIMNYKGSGKLLEADIKEYGKENFQVEVLEYNIDNLKDLNDRERYWIKFFDAKNSEMGYNMTDGGEGCPNPLPEVLRSKSEKQKGRTTWMKGKKHRPESIQKIIDHHADISGDKNYWFGTHLTPEIRKRMAENHADVSFDKNSQFNKKPKNTTSKYKGVSFSKSNNKWSSYITVAAKTRVYIGLFLTEVEAALAFNEVALEYFGWKANDRLNKIPKKEIDELWNMTLVGEGCVL